jgi:hypothetical protein
MIIFKNKISKTTIESSVKYFFRSALILILLITSTSCSSTRSSSENLKTQNEEAPEEKKSEKIDTKKLLKEGAYMIGWDIVLALACKSGLHFSIGVCLTADIVGDAGIILYHNLETKKPENLQQSNDKAGAQVAKEKQTEDQKKKSTFNPIEFVLSVSLMAVILILI